MLRRAITYAASKLRRRIFVELKRIETDPGYSIIVAHHDRPAAILMNYEEYLSWQKTLKIASDPWLVKSSDLQNIVRTSHELHLPGRIDSEKLAAHIHA